MQVIKESEARMKLCPFMNTGTVSKQHCVTGYCMAWVIVKENQFTEKPK